MSKKTMTTPNLTKKELALTKRMTRHNHGRWIEAHPSASLGDLLDFLRAVEEELYRYDPDTVLVEIIDELDAAADYLSNFSAVGEPVTIGGQLATVSYRLADLGDDIGQVDELIVALGESYRVSRLPKWKR